MGLFSIMGNGHVDFPQVNTRYLVTLRDCLCLYHIGGNGFILGSCPMDNDRLRCFPRPSEYQWSITLTIGKSEYSILMVNSLSLILYSEVPSATTRGLCSGVSLTPLSPT